MCVWVWVRARVSVGARVRGSVQVCEFECKGVRVEVRSPSHRFLSSLGLYPDEHADTAQPPSSSLYVVA